MSDKRGGGGGETSWSTIVNIFRKVNHRDEL